MNYRSKRLVDLLIAVSALVVLSPVMLIIVMLVARYLGRPILFKQTRAGLYGQPFQINKFRTMTEARDLHGKLLPDEERLTRLGFFLRATGLDELPELTNVLKGEMSLVGPRPLLLRYLPRYSPEQARRHDVLPGITGWAQVNGRQDVPYEDRFKLDVWYVDHQSLWLDLKIIALTALTILRREGISRQGYATGPEFFPASAVDSVGTTRNE